MDARRPYGPSPEPFGRWGCKAFDVGWDLRLASTDDADEVSRLHAEINAELDRDFASAAKEEVSEDVIDGYRQLWETNLSDRSGHRVCVVVADSNVVGFADLFWSDEEESPELAGIYIQRKWRRKTIGEALVRWAKEEVEVRGAPHMRLWTFENNDRAQRFFERHFGRRTGRRRSPDQRSALAAAGLELVEYILPSH